MIPQRYEKNGCPPTGGSHFLYTLADSARLESIAQPYLTAPAAVVGAVVACNPRAVELEDAVAS